VKIVDRKAFLAMPAGTVFAKYEPHMLGEVQIKGDTVRGIDFFCVDLTSVEADHGGEWLEQIERAGAGEDVPLDYDTESRDGLFDADQLFAVWSLDDVRALICRLERTLRREPLPTRVLWVKHGTGVLLKEETVADVQAVFQQYRNGDWVMDDRKIVDAVFESGHEKLMTLRVTVQQFNR
jgi:hypothetical protein